MAKHHFLSIHPEGLPVLLYASLIAIPFNIILGIILVLDLIHVGVPETQLWVWLIALAFFSAVRWIFSYYLIKLHHLIKNKRLILSLFCSLTFLMGGLWSVVYFLAFPYVSELHEFIIILVFGGMCAGSVTTLSVYFPAYASYILPIFIPVILYNALLYSYDRLSLSLIFTIFVLGMLITAKMNSRMLYQIFRLTDEKEELIRELQIRSNTDALTCLLNRGCFNENLLKELNFSKRNNFSFSLIIMNVDNFKLVNESLGYLAGDKFLQNFAGLLHTHLKRASDSFYRLGGDEFAILIANTDAYDTENLALSLMYLFKQDKFSFMELSAQHKHLEDKVTLSLGIVFIAHPGEVNPQNIIEAADTALFQSKNEGKNKISTKRL